MTDQDVLGALNKLKTDLDWQGPSGKQLGNIVVNRRYARALAEFVERKLAEKTDARSS